MIVNYYKLTKPGIILGNLITTTSAFILASRGTIDGWKLLAALLGLSLIIGSACVFNNYIDRHADEKMARTRQRALPQRLISIRSAVIFASLLAPAGILVLALGTNLLTLSIALTGLFVYVVLYSLLKYRSTHATLVGAIAGGIPPLVGYCAASNRLDLGALLLFAILVLWQMPHFFAIAMFRFNDYAAASIPVLPVKRGMHITKVQILLYIIAFMLATALLTLFHYTGYAYLVVAALLGCAWLVLSIRGFRATDDQSWARKMFRSSLLIVIALSVMIAVDGIPQ